MSARGTTSAALFALVRAGARRHSAYPLALAAGAFTNSVFGLLRAAVLAGAVAGAGGAIAGYGYEQAVTYSWLTQALIAPLAIFGWRELALRVHSGEVAVDLLRPVHPQTAHLAQDLGRIAVEVLPRSLPPLAVGALTTGLFLSPAPAAYLLGTLSALLAAMLMFLCHWLVNLAAFWLIQMRGLFTLHMVATNLFSGFLVPVPWLPDWLQTVLHATPFPSVVQTPIDILLGSSRGSDAAALLAVQLAWLLGVAAAGRIVFALGARRLVVQGG